MFHKMCDWLVATQIFVIFTSNPGGKGIQFDGCIFFKWGWFNHQPGEFCINTGATASANGGFSTEVRGRFGGKDSGGWVL